ncbi:MAG: hypothetical protein K0R18_304 [Bacillales bacterium]|jgi:hypothetical protein|nr:hypothetical protein [Bacillales bacterium]
MKIKLKKSLIVLISALVLAGCAPDYTKQGTVSSSQELTASYVEKVPGKLYFIPHKDGEADFPVHYAAFLKAFPNLKIIGFTEVGNEDTHNAAAGYFILTENK